jgi:coproporphyrinogen III oxidase
MNNFKEKVVEKWLEIQQNICSALENADSNGETHFREDRWERPEGGGGRSRILENGQKIEKGGVLFSAVHGELPPQTAKMLGVAGGQFFATGVSIVLHPRNPFCPIMHMNIRYFETDGGRWWFGGGIDLTPHFVDEIDAKYFHQQLKNVCDLHHPDFYAPFKMQADDYFFIKHRQETRGIGGIFFDYLDEKSGLSKDQIFDFVADVGGAFAPIYSHFLQKNHLLPYSDREKRWQLLRRGRYVEFNLVWDKGTKFGLETNGRTESILMSLPPHADWTYDFKPEPDSPEFFTQSMLVKGKNWLE